VLALVVLAVPARWLGVTAGLGALVELGTLGGLLLAITVGLFGFVETWQAPLVLTTVLIEAAGTLVLGGFALLELFRHRADLLQRVAGYRQRRARA
jgi:hypothetical protein